MTKIGVLLVNLGTPNSPKPSDIKKYLTEFLTDERVINIPWLPRQWLVRRIIVPRRYKESAKMYQQIWTPEGSPLMVYGRKVQHALQEKLGPEYAVELAMRYQHPSIGEGLGRLYEKKIDRLIVLPLFPQYASATTGSLHQNVMEEIRKWNVIPEMTMIQSYATHPKLIEAFCAVAQKYDLSSYDHILFSFHGLPKKQLKQADRQNHCLVTPDCCSTLCSKNKTCYSAQCYATGQAIASKLALSSDQYSICFQSRLGKDPWIEPYTSDVIEARLKAGDKKVLVFCPAFVCDCLETTFEIGVEYNKEFLDGGGETLDLVEGLNDHPKWIETLEHLVHDYLPQLSELHPSECS